LTWMEKSGCPEKPALPAKKDRFPFAPILDP
jgi:hypothetical protein